MPMLLQDPRDTKGTGDNAGGSRETPEGPGGTRTRGDPRDTRRTGGHAGNAPGGPEEGNHGGIGAGRKAIRALYKDPT